MHVKGFLLWIPLQNIHVPCTSLRGLLDFPCSTDAARDAANYFSISIYPPEWVNGESLDTQQTVSV